MSGFVTADRAGSRGSVNGGGGGGGGAPKIFFLLQRTSEPCERENFARQEIVFMLSDAFQKRISQNNTC